MLTFTVENRASTELEEGIETGITRSEVRSIIDMEYTYGCVSTRKPVNTTLNSRVETSKRQQKRRWDVRMVGTQVLWRDRVLHFMLSSLVFLDTSKSKNVSRDILAFTDIRWPTSALRDLYGQSAHG